MTGDGFDPYDDSIPVGQRLGSQQLFEPVPEVEQAEPPEPGEVVNISKRLSHRQRTPLKAPPQQPTMTPPSKTPRDHRETISTWLEVTGLTAFSAGFFLIHLWLGLIILGLCLVLLGVATSNQLTGPRD